MLTDSLEALDQHRLAAAYVADIEQYVAENRIEEALNQLQDFVLNLAPNLKHSVLLCRRRYTELRESLINGTVHDATRETLYKQILMLCDETKRYLPKYEVASQQSAQPSAFKSLSSLETTAEQSIDLAESLPNVNAQLHRYWEDFRDARPSEDTTVLVSKNVALKFGQFDLEPITLSVQSGQIVGVIGKNGSGKTTLLSLLASRLSPDHGIVHYPKLARGEHDWSVIRRKIAYIPQLASKWPGPVGLNLTYTAAVFGKRGLDNANLVNWYIDRFELRQYLNHSFDELSGGYRMRYELVKALISSPSLIIMDEPLAPLDVDARHKFLRGLRAIAYSLTDSIPIIISSQHIDEVEAIADYLIVLDNGKLAYTGPADAVALKSQYLYFEIATPLSFDSIKTSIGAHNLSIVERTIDGYVIRASKSSDDLAIFDLLCELFRGSLIGIRNVSNSARKFFTKRDLEC
jgi:ABC-2 type transport system ATP-binding protein